MDKTWNNKAWFMVMPVLVLVAFSAVIPLMTVVNYAVQDTFGNNQFFWYGTDCCGTARFGYAPADRAVVDPVATTLAR